MGPPFVRSSVRSSVHPFVRSSVRPFVRSSVRPFVRACGTSLFRWMALQCAKRTASRLAQATVARLVKFESLKWKYSFTTNSALFMKLGSLLYVRCRHRSAKSTAVSNKTFLFQVTNIYLFCGSVTLST